MCIKNNKGITLVALVITVIIILVIGAITVYEGSKLVDEAKYEVEAERLEELSNIKHSDRKMLRYYSPFILIPASIGGLAAAVACPNMAASIALVGASTVGAVHSINVINRDFPKITKGKKMNIFAALKELNKKSRELLSEYLVVSNKLDEIRERKTKAYKELDSLNEYRRDITKMICEQQKKVEDQELEPLFVEVVEEYRKEQPIVKKLK